MPILTKLREFLDANHVQYEVRSHPQAFTAQAVAEAEHIPGREVAKTVMFRSAQQYLMIVLAAPYRVNLQRARHESGHPDLHLASEAEFSALFPQCELGAMPPFGNLYGLPVWVDAALTKQQEIVFNAGNHRQTVHMAYADFAPLVQPKVVAVAELERR